MAPTAHSKSRSAMYEFDLIRTIQQRHRRHDPSVIRGIGDDAAIVTSEAGEWSLLTTDLLAEDIHFDLRTATMADIGFRAAVANLSDIAAMGGTPQYLLVSLAIPRTGASNQIHQLYRGMMAACRPHRVTLIGGDTSASANGWFINITLVGRVSPRKALLRNGARAGDLLYVTGTIGDALAGLMLLNEPPSKKRLSRTTGISPTHRQFLVGRYLRPTARLAEGQWLSAHRLATSAIDLSDGLSGDLRHICEESHVGVELDLSALPLSPACRAYATSRKLDPAALALTGGEDYELLFTLPPRRKAEVERAATLHRFRITCIGAIRQARQGIQAIGQDRTPHPLPSSSYEHFK